MQREIKFRIWRKESEQMYDLGHLADCLMTTDFEENFGSNLLEYEIMQFTGLKDKNGKEIYEGDVVRHRELRKDREAIFKYGMLTAMEGQRSHLVRYERCGFDPFVGWTDEANLDLAWEVVGNVYENPWLLQTKS